jgi:hypothetical protein
MMKMMMNMTKTKMKSKQTSEEAADDDVAAGHEWKEEALFGSC